MKNYYNKENNNVYEIINEENLSNVLYNIIYLTNNEAAKINYFFHIKVRKKLYEIQGIVRDGINEKL